ncbi:hypothetical protein ZHAS_00006015 [Anopheles sinensis]|uniref:Uncharacterized protein n=1 Tax=Anopheles sinensis TaxID=74873 RepID=A0A084VKY4_ANOSI|nr:hypothetical protein ZHAS_00006015 [Anopheles sinensis]
MATGVTGSYQPFHQPFPRSPRGGRAFEQSVGFVVGKCAAPHTAGKVICETGMHHTSAPVLIRSAMRWATLKGDAACCGARCSKAGSGIPPPPAIRSDE